MSTTNPLVVSARMQRVLETIILIMNDEVPTTQKYKALEAMLADPRIYGLYQVEGEVFPTIRLGKVEGAFNPFYFRREKNKMVAYVYNKAESQVRIPLAKLSIMLGNIIAYRQESLHHVKTNKRAKKVV